MHRLLPHHPLGRPGRHALRNEPVHRRRGEEAQLFGPGAEDVGVDECPGDALPSGAAPARVRPRKAPAGDEILCPLEHDAHPLQLVEAEVGQPPRLPDAAGALGADARHPQQHLEGGTVDVHREQPIVLDGPVALGVEVGVKALVVFV